MKGILVRVGIDSDYGEWNAPMDPESNDYCYLPIPENEKHQIIEGMEEKYSTAIPSLNNFASRYRLDLFSDLRFPRNLIDHNMHLDPDFNHLTYGDNGDKRGKGAASLVKGDFLAFYAAFKPVKPSRHNLVYALIGFYEVDEVIPAKDVPEGKLGMNAHTRKRSIYEGDVVVFGEKNSSGRFKKCIPMGEYRNRAYRVEKSVLSDWGGLDVKDGFIQRSNKTPPFLNPLKFRLWLEEKKTKIIQNNFD